jgi:hypothetical protein
MGETWPELRWEDWSATADTLHMWTQIVGKVRLALMPMQAHWWNVPLYVSARGLSTSAMPYGDEFLEIEFDFMRHELLFRLSTGANAAMALRAQSVAGFYMEFQRTLRELGCDVSVWAIYDPEAAHRFWRVLMRVDQVLQKFSSRFVGKVSPVHFFWGSFDLAVTRFSGRAAPPREGADAVTLEAYSQEVISAGFWPGNGGYGKAAFYCYAAPAPKGLDAAVIEPEAAFYDKGLGEFILLYEDVRGSEAPEETLMAFLESTYGAAADLAGWDRKALERERGAKAASFQPGAVS